MSPEQRAALDGHHRIRACEELGITDYPTIIRTGMNEDQKREHVLALNLDRRHLTRDQRKELTAKLRAEGWSLRRIAERVHVHHDTVREDLAGVGNPTPDAEPPAKVTGADGKQYPATRPKSIPCSGWCPAELQPIPTPTDASPTRRGVARSTRWRRICPNPTRNMAAVHKRPRGGSRPLPTSNTGPLRPRPSRAHRAPAIGKRGLSRPYDYNVTTRAAASAPLVPAAALCLQPDICRGDDAYGSV